MTAYKMFSPQALRHFDKFADEVQRTSKNPKGAHDTLTPDLKRAVAHDRLNRAENYPRPKWARDEQAQYGTENNGAKRNPGIAVDDEAPDPETVQLILKALQEGQPGEEVMMEVVKALHERWPGCAGEWPGLDEEAGQEAMDDEYGSYWPGQRRNQEADESVVGANDLPPPFKGRPTPGGHLVGDAAYLRRFPNAARIECATPYALPRKKATMATDRAMSKAASSYNDRFPNASRIGIGDFKPRG